VVARAAALAVLFGLVATVSSSDEPADVAATRSDRADSRPATELPAIVDVRCGPAGIVVPVASVRPQSDGLHLRVLNSHRGATTVWVEGDEWASGSVRVAAGVTRLRQPVPPGVLTIGCEVQGEREQRRVDLVDVDGLYQVPHLACDADDRTALAGLAVEPETPSLVTATRRALEPVLQPGDSVGAVRGYVGQRLGDPTTDPVTQLSRDSEVVAFIRLRGAEEEPVPPWVVAEVEACADVAADLGAESDGAASSDGEAGDDDAGPGGGADDGSNGDEGSDGDGDAGDDDAGAVEGTEGDGPASAES
jgi:hypothetical protein